MCGKIGEPTPKSALHHLYVYHQSLTTMQWPARVLDYTLPAKKNLGQMFGDPLCSRTMKPIFLGSMDQEVSKNITNMLVTCAKKKFGFLQIWLLEHMS